MQEVINIEVEKNITRYSYDTFGRLQSVTDHEGKTVQAYEYNYKNQ